MATINNTDTIKRILDDGGIQTAHDDVPTKLAEKVVPVLISNPQRIVNVLREFHRNTTTAASSIYNTPATGKTFYLTGIMFTNEQDATSDNILLEITAVIDGLKESLIRFDTITTTASSKVVAREFSVPIKLDKNSTISFAGVFTAGVCTSSACITGYLVED